MSALPPKADILGGGVDVRFGSKADIFEARQLRLMLLRSRPNLVCLDGLYA